MKKSLGAVLAAALAFPTGPVSAAVFNNLKVGGMLDVQSNTGRNVTDFSTNGDIQGVMTYNDRLGGTLSRILVNSEWDASEGVHARVSLRKNDRNWGTTGAAGQGATSNNQALVGGAQAADVASNVYVQQANLKVDKLFGNLDMTVGRQYYGEPGSLIAFFGPTNTYGLAVSAVDAVRLDGSCERTMWTALLGVITGSGVSTNPNTTTNVWGLDVGWKGLPVGLNTYLWNQTSHRTGALNTAAGKNDRLWIVGAKAKGEAMGGWASLEFALNTGQFRNTSGAGTTAIHGGAYTGKALLADVGYKLDVSNVAAFTPWFNFGWGSGREDNQAGGNGNFMAINSDYRPGVINGRFNTAGVATYALGTGLDGIAGASAAGGVSTQGLSNRVVWGFGMKATPSKWEKLTLGLSYWNFAFNKATKNSPAFTAGGMAKTIGSEVGLTADWKYSDSLSVGAGLATFQPGKFVKNVISADRTAIASTHGVNSASVAFADLSLKFGGN